MTKIKIKSLVLFVLAALLLGLVIWTVWGNTALEQNTYTIKSGKLSKAFDGYRIAHISDLHNTEIGQDNHTLISLLREAKPDLIAVTGDLVDSRHTDMEIALRFMEEAVTIAPCYYVTGNHEERITAYEELKAGLTERGVTVLEDARTVIERSGETITLIGVNDPSFEPDPLLSDEVLTDTKLKELLCEEDRFTVLLSHRPELFEVYAEHDVDVVLTGHAHGGQFRLPFVGGLIAPHQGLFPKYDAGLYTDENTHMLVSRGIGNSLMPFRFNNRPEILLIELKNAE